ncbi:MAG: guanylate kinase, partial [Coriobacteriaceae bacterium]|nr:guanylate kinase [Coriobacteriaceae bacterium]
MRSGNLFVISGPSGAGKGTLVARLLQEVGDARVSVSVTTRAPRVGETDGVDYCFVSEDAFDQLVQDDALLEWAFVYGGCRYGTLRKAVEDHVAQ